MSNQAESCKFTKNDGGSNIKGKQNKFCQQSSLADKISRRLEANKAR